MTFHFFYYTGQFLLNNISKHNEIHKLYENCNIHSVFRGKWKRPNSSDVNRRKKVKHADKKKSKKVKKEKEVEHVSDSDTNDTEVSSSDSETDYYSDSESSVTITDSESECTDSSSSHKVVKCKKVE